MQKNRTSITNPTGASAPRRARPGTKDSAFGTAAVVGLGYVGLPLALLARERGWNIIGLDIDDEKRRRIREADVPDLDENYLAALRGERLETSASFETMSGVDIIVICVPTPVNAEHEPDLAPLKSACLGVAAHLEPGQLVIIESTINPGTTEEVLIPLMNEASGLTAGEEYGVAHCPERINPGDAQWPVERIPRVIGASTPAARTRAATFYRSILEAPVREMETLREAEAVKMVENCFRDINIAFVNELAMSFSKLGIDIEHVLDGAATKPFSFMRHSPGCGVGGHCIPVDPYYLIRYARSNGFSHEFLSLARSINNRMPHFTVELLQTELGRRHEILTGAKVALLGLSYKSNVSDLRESPSFEIAEILSEEGAEVRTFDPFAPERSSAKSLEEALDGADAAVIATAHDAFAELPPSAFLERGVRIVIDGRNCLPKEEYLAAGIAYKGIGR